MRLSISNINKRLSARKFGNDFYWYVKAANKSYE